MTAPSILLVGAGGHAAACIDVIEQEGRFAIAGLVGSAQEAGKTVLGYRVLGTDEDLRTLVAEYAHALVAVGQIKSATVRVRLFVQLQNLGCEMPTIISPRAYVSPHAVIGSGTVVMHGAVINARARIGNNCILNSQSLVEHDVVIGDHCHVATAASINGGVRVGTQSFIGSGAILREGLVIGDRCIIGMGQRVVADCAADTRLAGNEAS